MFWLEWVGARGFQLSQANWQQARLWVEAAKGMVDTSQEWL